MEGVEITEGWLQLKVRPVQAAQGCSALPEALSAERSCGTVVVSCSAAERGTEGASVDISHLMAVFYTTQLCPPAAEGAVLHPGSCEQTPKRAQMR